jgi:hypothetical protein
MADIRQLAQKLLDTHPHYQQKPTVLGELVTQLRRIQKAKGLSDTELAEGIRIVCADPDTYYYPLGAFNSFGFINQACALTDTAQEKQAKSWNDKEQAISGWRETQAYWDKKYATDPVYRAMKDEYRDRYPDRFVTLENGRVRYSNEQ